MWEIFLVLHERKRHTTLCVASTPSVVLAGEVPHPRQEGGTPGWVHGVPPILTWWGYPRVSPTKDVGPVEVLWDGDRVPPERTWDQWKYYGMEIGYTPPPHADGQTHWSCYRPHPKDGEHPLDAGGNNFSAFPRSVSDSKIAKQIKLTWQLYWGFLWRAIPFPDDKIKWIVWLPMVLFTLDDKILHVVVVNSLCGYDTVPMWTTL